MENSKMTPKCIAGWILRIVDDGERFVPLGYDDEDSSNGGVRELRMQLRELAFAVIVEAMGEKGEEQR